jgi:glycerate dehydrogenase
VIISSEIVAQLPKLKHIAVIATGYNNIDIEACRLRHVAVSNTRGYANTSVPEHVLAMIFSLGRHLPRYHQSVRDGSWQQSDYFHHYLAPIKDLASSQIGIIGSGDLGRGTAVLAKAMGMTVVYADRKGCASSGKTGFLPFEQVIADSDVISLHCPLSEDTRNLIALPECRP